MTSPKREVLPIREEADVVRVRKAARDFAVALGLGLVDQTKLVTAASELARNTLTHGQGGQVTLELFEATGRRGLKLSFEDQGPGIPDIARAMADGYTTGTGLGLGLSGARRLVPDFEIASEVGKGTRVAITKWK